MAVLDQELLSKMAKRLEKSPKYVREQISKRASRKSLQPAAAQILWAKELGIGTAIALRKLAPHTVQQLQSVSVAPTPAVVTHYKEQSSRRSQRTRTQPQKRRGTSVFVVHGRNLKLRDAMFEFLRALGLNPIEWIKAIRMTGQGSPYVGAVLETAFRTAAAVVVLLTPDDEARLRRQFRLSSDPAHETTLTGQARANVLFEAGMAFGKDPNSTVLVQFGNIRPFSDVAGRHAVKMADTPSARHELATKLANAGCNVDMEGSDWLSAGKF